MSNNSRAPEPVKDSQAAKIRLTLMAKRYPAFAEFAERVIESLPENADFGRTIAFLDSLLESAHNLDQARDIGQETVRLAEQRSAAAAVASTAAATSDAGQSMLSPAHISKKKRVADDANLTVDITPSCVQQHSVAGLCGSDTPATTKTNIPTNTLKTFNF